MVSSVGEGIRDRLANIWDTTSTAKLLGLAACVVGLIVVAALALGRDGGNDDAGVIAGSEAQTGSSTTTTEPVEEEPEPIRPFFVVGDNIVDPEGNIFVPIGVNGAIRATPYPYVYDGGNGGINGRVESVKAWGWNTVRASLQCYNETGVPSQQQIIDGIDDTVTEFTEAGIVVILTCHDGTGADVELESELELQVRSFWDEVVPAYSDNPYVWFNFFNEPFKTRLPNEWKDLHRFYYDRYRAQDVNNIMVFDLPDFGQAIDMAANDSFVNNIGRACNTVLGWHAWGSLNGQQAEAADYADFSRAVRGRGLAVMIGEAGVPDPPSAGTAGNPEWNTSGYYAAVEVASNSEVGLLWWHGTGDTDKDLFYPLKNDRSGFWTANNSGNLTEAGQSFWDFSQTARPVEKFAGDIAVSGCEAAFDVINGTEEAN